MAASLGLRKSVLAPLKLELLPLVGTDQLGLSEDVTVHCGEELILACPSLLPPMKRSRGGVTASNSQSGVRLARRRPSVAGLLGVSISSFRHIFAIKPLLRSSRHVGSESDQAAAAGRVTPSVFPGNPQLPPKIAGPPEGSLLP